MLADMFWARWKREYLQTLQTRRKWQTPKVNLRKGDVVLLKDSQTCRGEWPMALVENATPSDAIIAIIVSFPNPHCSYRFLSVADFCIRYRIYYCSEIGFYPLPFRPTFISENKESFSLQLKFIFSPHSVSFFLEFCRFTYFGFVHNTKCF